MKITIINASPRLKKSNSEILKNYLLSYIKENEINEYFSFSIKLDNNIKTDIYSSNVLIFIFPLYVDSIPANLLELLIKFENFNAIFVANGWILPQFATICHKIYVLLSNALF